MFFWTTLYFRSVTVAPTWLVTPPSQNLNWPSGKLQPPAEFLSLGHILILSFWIVSKDIYMKNPEQGKMEEIKVLIIRFNIVTTFRQKIGSAKAKRD